MFKPGYHSLLDVCVIFVTDEVVIILEYPAGRMIASKHSDRAGITRNMATPWVERASEPRLSEDR